MVKEQLTQLITAAYHAAVRAGDLPLLEILPAIELDMPKVRAHGDYASNVALILAKPLQKPPRAVAEALSKHIAISDPLSKVEVAGPGFLNFTLRPGWLHDILRRIEAEGEKYGQSSEGADISLLVEFVSANPNGPITVAHGRGGAIGDALASLLEATGYRVSREFYINDALNSKQMNNFGRSVHLRYMQLLGHALPDAENSDWLYKGDYVSDIARAIIERAGSAYEQADIGDPATVQLFRHLAQEGMQQQQKEDLKAFGIVFDRWFSEQTVHESGAVKKEIDALTAKGFTYELDGALWLKSTEFGDDKDRVLMRADGTPTYIAGDVAYHIDKLSRFDKLVDIWGADHFGYVSRTKAAITASGYDADRLYVLLFQLVRIMKNGEFVRSSKRAGDVLELRSGTSWMRSAKTPRASSSSCAPAIPRLISTSISPKSKARKTRFTMSNTPTRGRATCWRRRRNRA